MRAVAEVRSSAPVRDACRVLAFARAPRPGEVKTRLAPALGAAGAARLHRRLVAHALGVANEAGVGPVELWCAPDASHPFFAECAASSGVSLHEQPPGDLGARMLAAFRAALERSRAALLIGTDLPALDAPRLREAAETLAAGVSAVFVPAEDGGYGLVGLSGAHAALFEAMPWGGDTVMERTREGLRTLGLTWRELAPAWDVDRPGDLPRLAREFPQLMGESHAI